MCAQASLRLSSVLEDRACGGAGHQLRIAGEVSCGDMRLRSLPIRLPPRKFLLVDVQRECTPVDIDLDDVTFAYECDRPSFGGLG